MTTITDIKLVLTDDRYDMIINDDGDLDSITGLQTSLIMSLLTNQRATADEVYEPIRREGTLADLLFANFRHGSKLWLLDQVRNDFNARNIAITNTQNALQWLIDDSLAKQVDVEGDVTISGIVLTILITYFNNVRENWAFNLWNNTIKEVRENGN